MSCCCHTSPTRRCPKRQQSPWLSHMAVDEVFVSSTNDQLQAEVYKDFSRSGSDKDPAARSQARCSKREESYLPGNCELVEMLIAHRSVLLVLIIEHDRDARLSDPGLALLVDEVLQTVGTNLQARGPSLTLVRECFTVDRTQLGAAVFYRDVAVLSTVPGSSSLCQERSR